MLLPGKLCKSERSQVGSVRASYLYVPRCSEQRWRNKQSTCYNISDAPITLQHSRGQKLKASNRDQLKYSKVPDNTGHILSSIIHEVKV